MTKIAFKINEKVQEISIEGSPAFAFGKAETLSSAATDIAYHQVWYPKGFEVFDLLSVKEFEHLKQGITHSIKTLLRKSYRLAYLILI
jgi:hypothetical protein